MDEKEIPTTAKPSLDEKEVDTASQDRLSGLLSSIQSGWKVTILRGEPGWCRGHLETIEYYGDEDNEPIDVNYLIRQWGGRKLYLKVHNEGGKWVGGGSISLFSYPPKVRGQILNEMESYGMTPGPQGTFSQNVQPHYPPPPPQPGFDVAKLFEMASNQKGANLESVMKMMETFRAQMPQPQPVDPMAGMQQMMGMAQMFKQMREIFGDLGGDGGGGGGGGDGDGIAPIAAEVVKALVASRQQPAPARGSLTGPRPGFTGPPKSGAPTQNAPQNVPPPKENDIEAGNIMQIAKRLSDLNPEDAAGCIHLAYEGMPKEKSEEAAQAFMRQMGDGEGGGYQDPEDP